MRKIYLLIITLCTVQITHAQITIGSIKDGKLVGINGRYPTDADYPEYRLPEYDFTALKENIEKTEPDIPFQFGKAFDVRISLKNGKWYETAQGKNGK